MTYVVLASGNDWHASPFFFPPRSHTHTGSFFKTPRTMLGPDSHDCFFIYRRYTTHYLS
ncbi:uncharacterized protein BKA55DRAFT_581933 [Fusarium redolens]|uniref:Uncharacterized protein n=1 Tax=Fusarium redolens TaxID=48865 RepID=A0A9P9G3F6_FUSRE|nr:uncharacterized protein BKA55DRAFT_581933 [Fusarium redolens]KAH7231826.1 hypothetical protein BKA55DRAFT_581933 [Fusarium redolens]